MDSRREQDLLDRVRLLEAQLRTVCEHLGIAYQGPPAPDDMPDEVRALVESGDRLRAAREYARVMGVGLQDATIAIGRIVPSRQA